MKKVFMIISMLILFIPITSTNIEVKYNNNNYLYADPDVKPPNNDEPEEVLEDLA